MTRDRSSQVRRVIVVGSGVAGSTVACALAARGQPVLLLSRGAPSQARSGDARGGINAVVDSRADSAADHLVDTLVAGEFRAPQRAVRAMVEAAPEIVHYLDRAGVPFLRSEAGTLARFGHAGARHRRTMLAGSDTGRQVLGVLEDQLRRWGAVEAHDGGGRRRAGEPLVRLLTQWDLVALVRDDNGVVVGVVAQNRHTLRCKAFPGEAVCLATGSAAGLFVPFPSGAVASGSGISIAWRAGAALAAAEAVAWHPTAVGIHDQRFALAEGLRGEGARIWIARSSSDERQPTAVPERDRDYPLERHDENRRPELTRSAAARTLAELGVGPPDAPGARGAYVDLNGIPGECLADRFDRLFKATGTKPDRNGRWPLLRVFPRVHDTLGGLWIDHEPKADGTLASDSPRNHATNLPGLYAAGACASLYHGAGLLGGNDLLACLFGASCAAAAITTYRGALARSAEDLPNSVFEQAESTADAASASLLERGEPRETLSHFVLRQELVDVMTRTMLGASSVDVLTAAKTKLAELTEQAASVRIPDRTTALNPSLEEARHLDHLLTLAPVVLEAIAHGDATEASGAEPRGARPRRRTLAILRGGEVRLVAALAYDCAGTRVEVTDEVDSSLMPNHNGSTTTPAPFANGGETR